MSESLLCHRIRLLGFRSSKVWLPKNSVTVQAESEGRSSEVETMSRTGSSPIRAYRAEDQAALKAGLQPPSRKELAYAGHLDRVHQ